MPSFTTQDIAARVSGELVGPGGLMIRGVEHLDAAGPEQITFIRDAQHAAAWLSSKAGAVLVSRGTAVEAGSRAVILVPDADLALATVLALFAPAPARPEPGIHPAAVVDPSAGLGAGVAVGAGCYIGPRVRIGEGTILHANVTILDEARIGGGCEFYPGVVIRDRCELGDRVILHPNVVIGADGFGYRKSLDPKKPGLVKIPQIGIVRIGDDVEIGACTCVDRAKLSATVIGQGTKIDNLCQIGHNCIIGRFCILCGQVGLAGSVTIGDGSVLGGKVAVKDQVTIGAGAQVAACAAVMTNIPAGETWGGYPARDIREAFREHAAMRKLPELVKLLRKK